MKVMVVGGGGQLGQKVREILKRETAWEVSSVSRSGIALDGEVSEFNTLERKEWKSVVLSADWKPDVIVNAAAMTNVDHCETDREGTWKTNVHLVEILTEMCRKVDARFIQISTDYIFDGKNGPYTEDAVPNPVNYYGRTKLAAENVCKNSRIYHTVLRTIWMYGVAAASKMSFVEWLISQLSVNGVIRIVDDELGNPTMIEDVANAILKTIEIGYNGLLNIAGADIMSRLAWAKKIATCFGFDPERILPIGSRDLNRAATRPLKSGLITLKAQTVLGLKPTGADRGLEIYRILRERKSGGEKHSLRKLERKNGK